MKRVFVTGATGRVGANLCQALLESGCEVRALVMPGDPKAGKLEPLDVEVVAGDLRDARVIAGAVEGCDGVVHAASLMGLPEGMTEKELFEVNCTGTLNIATAAGRHADAISRFVYVSSSAIYPNDSHQITPAYLPVDEQHPRRPTGLYGLTKLCNESIVRYVERATDLMVSIIRPSGITAGAENLPRWRVSFVAAILRTGVGKPESQLYAPGAEGEADRILAEAGGPDRFCAVYDMAGRPWLYQMVDVRDVVQGILCALRHPAAVGQVFNISAARAIPIADGARYLAEKTGEELYECRVPCRWIYSLDCVKARSYIDYQPACDFKEMIDTGLAALAGQDTGVIPP